MTIAELIQQLAKAEQMFIQQGTVKTVDADKRTCTVEPFNGDADLLEVRLQANINNAGGFYLKPKIDTTVLVGFINKDVALVIHTSEIESLLVEVGAISLLVDTDGIQLNGDDLGGIVKAKELKTQLDKLTARVDGIISAINKGVPAAGSADGGTALQNTIKAQLATLKNKEDFSKLESDTTKHG